MTVFVICFVLIPVLQRLTLVDRLSGGNILASSIGCQKRKANEQLGSKACRLCRPDLFLSSVQLCCLKEPVQNFSTHPVLLGVYD